MKTRIEDWDESFLDVEDFQVERALQRGALDAIHRARRCGTGYVIWENEQVKSVAPDQTAPYENQMLENLERLNRKISELQGQSAQPDSLNDRPEK
jgi:hypothetical protein